MKANVQVLTPSNKSGEKKDGSGSYSLDFGHFLDLETFDKLTLMLDDDQLNDVKRNVGKRGELTLGFNPKNEKLTFSGFKAAA